MPDLNLVEREPENTPFYFSKRAVQGLTLLAIGVLGLAITSLVHYGLKTDFMSGYFISGAAITPFAVVGGAFSIYRHFSKKQSPLKVKDNNTQSDVEHADKKKELDQEPPKKPDVVKPQAQDVKVVESAVVKEEEVEEKHTLVLRVQNQQCCKEPKELPVPSKKEEKLLVEKLKYFLNKREDLPVEQITYRIFNSADKSEIIPLLQAVRILYPSYIFSPLDKICKNIFEDENHTLTNTSLYDMLAESGLQDNKEALTLCFDLAYRLNHPYIYRVSPTTVKVSEYTLNFLWINLNPQNRNPKEGEKEAENIFGRGDNSFENAECIKNPDELRAMEAREHLMQGEELEDWKKIKETFAYKISKWADVHRGARINLWYDSALVTQQAQQRTFAMMREIGKSRGVDLQMRDIRHLPNMDAKIERIFHPGTNVYTRVDLAKALISDYMMTSSEKYCIVSDIDVMPMSSKELFDQRTLDFLSTSGYAFNRVGFRGLENSFLMFSTEKEKVRRIHRDHLIDTITEELSGLSKLPLGTDFDAKECTSTPIAGHFVYGCYRSFIKDMGEPQYFSGRVTEMPRKVVTCPGSQFNNAPAFLPEDFKSERFRFLGNDPVPYTRNGRAHSEYAGAEGQISSLKGWKKEPLPPPPVSK